MEAGPTHGRPIMEAMGERTSASTPTMPKVVSRNFLLGDICVIVDDAPPKKILGYGQSHRLLWQTVDLFNGFA